MSADLIWNRQGRIGLSITEQYASFAEVIEIAKAKIYKATQKLTFNCFRNWTFGKCYN